MGRPLYVDVTNTLLAASMTGVQRVAWELLSRLIEGERDRELAFLQERGPFAMGPEPTWAELDPRQALAAMRQPAARRVMPVPKRLVRIGDLEPGAVFFDVDAVWHNEVRRPELYPLLRSQGIAILAMHYDAVPVHHPELAHPATVEKFVPTLEAQLRYADRLLAISRTVRDDLLAVARDRGWPSCDVQVVRLGCDFTPAAEDGDAVGGDGAAAEDLAAVLERGGYLLSVGTLEPRKNLGLLLDAFDALSAEIPDSTLVLVGRTGWLVDDLVRRIEEHPLFGRRLFWLQRVTDAELKQLYARAGAMVYPSLYEGYGLPVVEAMAAGTLTLCSDRGALPEAAAGLAELFDPTSLDDLVALLRRTLTDEPARHQRRAELAAFEPPQWASTAAAVAEAVRDLGDARRVETGDERLQIVYLSVHPEILLPTLTYVEHLMPFVDEAVVVTPARLADRFYHGGSLPLRVLTDEEILGDDVERFAGADHQGRNWLLRQRLVRSDSVRDAFIMSDDDYRPLRPIPRTFFQRRGRTRAYYFHDLDDWPHRAAVPTPYDLGLRAAGVLLEAHGYQHPKAFSSHCPQLIDKRLYAEMLEHFGEEARRVAVDEWSIYFNYVLRRHPGRFEALPFRTLCWPARPTDWEGRYPPGEFLFENFYPDLYHPQEPFYGLPQEYSDDYHVHSQEKIARRQRLQADYDCNRQLRDASLARAAPADLAAIYRLEAGEVAVEMRGLPRLLECRAGACSKLLFEIAPVAPAPGRLVLLSHRILDAGGAVLGEADYPVDLSDVVSGRAAELVETPIIAPPRAGRYRVELLLRVDGLEPDDNRPGLKLKVLE